LPGKKKIHGVEFEIINQKENKGFACLVLKSKKVKEIGKIGEYQIVYEDGKSESIEIIADDPVPQKDTKSNICDWYPTFGQIEKENAKYVPVVSEEGIRYIYTLQWINPYPEKKIEKIVLKSEGEKTTGTLGILGITILK